MAKYKNCTPGTKKTKPLKGIKIKKKISSSSLAKKTKENQAFTAPTVALSKKLAAVINISQKDCLPFDVEEVKAIIDLIAPPNTTGIGRQPIFRTNEWPIPPSGGAVPLFKPVKVMIALMAFMYSTKTLNEALKEQNISESIFRAKIIRDYPEAALMYDLACARKADAYMDKAQEVMMGEIPEEYFEEGRNGTRRLTAAGIQHINNQTSFMTKRAQMQERRAYNDKSEAKVIFEVNTRSEAVDLEQYKNVPIADLASLL